MLPDEELTTSKNEEKVENPSGNLQQDFDTFHSSNAKQDVLEQLINAATNSESPKLRRKLRRKNKSENLKELGSLAINGAIYESGEEQTTQSVSALLDFQTIRTMIYSIPNL